MIAESKHQGACIWFTGLSGAGKTTLAKKTQELLRDENSVFMIDGDTLRQNHSLPLGFTPEDREENVKIAAEMAARVAKSGFIALAALISPYEISRQKARAIVESSASYFMLIHVSTPLIVCEERDVKGLYLKARAGEIDNFTGISDIYEIPSDADITIDTTDLCAEEASLVITREFKAARTGIVNDT